MADLRRHTGTKTLQFAWSLLVLFVVVAALTAAPSAATPLRLGAVGGGWLLGLFALGLRERRHWSRLVANSTFERGASAGTADLQQIVKGHSISVATDLPGVLSQTHTLVSAAIDGVDATFTITLDHVGDGAAADGLTTGNPTLDGAWVIEGAPKNVKLLLSADVQSALMDVDVPGTMTVTGERVEWRVPFTRLTPDELAACARAVAEIAERLERTGRGDVSPMK